MVNFKEMEHQGWVEKARFYDDYFADVTRQAIGPVLAGLGRISGSSLLDICCGTGDLAEGAAHVGADVTGVDFAAPMIEIARARIPSAHFDVGDAEKLNYGDASFDAVTCWRAGQRHLGSGARSKIWRHIFVYGLASTRRRLGHDGAADDRYEQARHH